MIKQRKIFINRLFLLFQRRKYIKTMQNVVSLFLAGQNKKPQPINTTSPLLIFKMKSDYFLLTRAQTKKAPEKYLMFVCGDKQYYSSFSRHVNLGYCHKVMDLLENVLRVTKKKMDISNDFDLTKKNVRKQSLSLQEQWLLLYQIHGFGNQEHQMKQFQMHEPVYGQKIALLDDQLNISQLGRITSLFKLGGHLFYFLTYNKNIQEVDPGSKKSTFPSTENKFMDALMTLSTPTNLGNNNFQTNFKPVICCVDNQIFHKSNNIPLLFGMSLQIDNIKLCIPFQCLLSQRPCKLAINPVVQYALMSTCYISYCGNYCTGIRINAKTIISTKHVLPTSDQAVGCQVKIRCFPYQQQGYGVVRRIGWDGLDFMQIDYHDEIREKFKFFQKQKQKNNFRKLLAIDKQESSFNKKIDSAELDRLQNNIYRKICEEVEEVSKTQVAKFNAVKSLETIFKQQSIQDSKLTPNVGNPLLAIGFGKFPYSSYLFEKLQIILPTIESGVVSKVVKLNQQTVFLKSDANLYNGFSGCGLWGYQGLLGMAVFILKNKNNEQQFNRHNFSYSTNFLSKLQRKKQSKQKKNLYSQSHINNIIESQINKELINFDVINNRNTINTIKISKKNWQLKPKL